MVVSALQVLCKVFNYSLTQLLLLACVHLELVKVSIVAVSKGPHLDTSLHWLHGHELLQGGATCEFNYGFVDGYLCVGHRGPRSVTRGGQSQVTPFRADRILEILLDWEWHCLWNADSARYHENDTLLSYLLSGSSDTLDLCSNNHQGREDGWCPSRYRSRGRLLL